MILRKPYAIFIKYFRLLHIVMASFVAFLLYKSYSIYNFFKLYSIDYRSVINNTISISFFDYFSIIFVIILTIILLVVMVYKNKPKNVYIYNLILYIVIFVLYYLCGNTINKSNLAVLDIKVSKAFRDFSLIACLFQSVSLILTVVRATGFDIKRFDFGEDLQKLDISEKDSEEIEVALDFDKDEVKRDFKRKFRDIKYVYVENKFVINSILAVFIFSICAFVYYRINSYSKYYSEGRSFSVSGSTVNVIDSYLLDSDSNGSKIANGGVIVAIKMQIKGYNKSSFNSGIMTLKIGDLIYDQNYEQAKGLPDLGNAYVNQKISSEFTTYLFTFEVSKEQARKNILLKLNDINSFVGGKVGSRNYYVKLKPNDLRKKNETVFNKKIGEKINFSDSVLGSSSLLITSFEVNNSFKLNYKYCYRSDKCIDSIEYLSASASGNYFKVLMKISGDLYLDESINSDYIYDLRSFLNNFGFIHYKVDDIWHKKRISSEVIKPVASTSKDYFIEVPYEVKNASEIYFSFDIRNQSYKYVLK